MSHPIERFSAPATITAGEPLKDILDRTAVRLVGDSLALAVPTFDRAAFEREAVRGLDALELKPRAAHIAAAMARHLAAVPSVAAAQLIASLGPELTACGGYGLRPFFYLPHSAWIHDHCPDHDAGLTACHALTRRFTAEYAIRPFLIRDQPATLSVLAGWAGDANPHVRRLVSEGTRPRLPWAERLPGLVADPRPVLPLLERLRDDPELYVRRSVANHLGDIAKDHPALVFDLCRSWLAGADDHRRWLIRHALRHPAKHGVAAAVRLRRDAGGR